MSSLGPRVLDAETERALRDSYEVANTVERDVPQPLVSVRTITYQHGAFIRDCIEGVLRQEVDFPFEYFIGEDCSTDGTREVAFDYAARYPSRIRLVTADRNVGFRANGMRTLVRMRGKYMALCEGDDYWIDPRKLADQVAMLEADPTMSACVSDAWNETDGVRTPFSEELERLAREKGFLERKDLLVSNIVPTASIVLRTSMLVPQQAKHGQAPAGDWLLLIRLAGQGRIGILPRKTTVRRRHAGGLISQKDDLTKAIFTLRCLVVIRRMVPHAERRIVVRRYGELNRYALERAYQVGGAAEGRKVWAEFGGIGLGLRQCIRWWMLLRMPGIMRGLAALRGRAA